MIRFYMGVITSYSIHYTKLYEFPRLNPSENPPAMAKRKNAPVSPARIKKPNAPFQIQVAGERDGRSNSAICAPKAEFYLKNARNLLCPRFHHIRSFP